MATTPPSVELNLALRSQKVRTINSSRVLTYDDAGYLLVVASAVNSVLQIPTLAALGHNQGIVGLDSKELLWSFWNLGLGVLSVVPTQTGGVNDFTIDWNGQPPSDWTKATGIMTIMSNTPNSVNAANYIRCG